MNKGKRAIFLLSLFLVVIVAGVVWVSFRDCAGWFRRSYHTIALGDNDFIDAKVRFRSQAAGTAPLPSRHLFGVTTVRASDCVEVIAGDEEVGSPSQAEDELQKRIRESGTRYTAGPVRYGEFIGERVILLVQKGPKVEIITQYKNDRALHIIQSVSLAHALAYEKLIQNGYRIDRDGYVIAQGK